MSTPGTQGGWESLEAGPTDAKRTVMFLPGALCSAVFYEDLMAEQALAGARLVAVTVPGWAGTTPPRDLSMEAYARATGEVAADLHADVVVGHSYGANVALEMAALGVFNGPVVLLSPSFSREDEAKVLGVLDKLGRIPLLGPGIWWLALKGVPSMAKKAVPGPRGKVLAAEMAKNTASFCKPNVKEYFAYLARYKNLVPRLTGSGVKAWVVFGTDDEIGLKDEERQGLEAAPQVTMATVEGTHMFLIENPADTAKIVADAVAAVG